jgi:DNA-directed RNA polymerase subunit B
MKTQPGAAPCKVRGFGNYSKIDSETGLPKDNVWLDEGDVVVGRVAVKTESKKEKTEGAVLEELVLRESYEDKSVRADKTLSGFVDRVYISRSPKDGARRMKMRLRKWRKPELGDKCASRHGQKGVIGMILPPESMPFTAGGIIPDLIINPHAFPTRMTIGHMIEAVISKMCCFEGCTYDGTPFEAHDIEQVYRMLERKGMNRHGNEVMYSGITGEQMETEVFIGPTYYMRLKHMVADKINYRVKGPVTSITHQPTKGRSNEGGLRIGNMESDVLVSHGLSAFLKESMMERSDGSMLDVDVDTGALKGYIAGLDNDVTVPRSRSIAAPHALQVFMAELNTLCLDPKLLLGDDGAAQVQANQQDMLEEMQLAMQEYMDADAVGGDGSRDL